jgi:hypothetical protein
MPQWLTILAMTSLVIAGACAVVIVVDILRGHPQHMAIMNLVWPITALYGGPLALWAYLRIGRLSTHRAMRAAKQQDRAPPSQTKPFWQTAGVAATHCGSGCTLGDLVGGGIIMTTIPFALFGHQIFGAWVVDFVLAYLFGIAFQYFSIAAMRSDMSTGKALVAALKADTLSLAAWQLGMYGWMAIVTFAIFGHELGKSDPVFWFMMQVAMLAGFVTAYPVNWWLVRAGIKEKM